MEKATPITARSDRSARASILVVEDEQDLQELLRYVLTREGYHVDCLGSGELAVRRVQSQPPDLMLLDLMLPQMDGLEVCRALKADPNTAHVPIIMVTAKGEEGDIVTGLELGADDYVSKPFSPRVLLARIRTVLRKEKEHDRQRADDSTVLRASGMTLHPERHEVHVADKLVDLTATEFRLLEMLMRRPSRVFTRQQIIEHIHGTMVAVTDRSVDVLVVGLRRKLGDAGKQIQTVRGVGYRLRE